MKKLLWFQTLILFGGTLFAWFTIINDFLRFHEIHGTFWQFAGTALPHPILTPCFWGGVAFIIATLWSGALTINMIPKNTFSYLRYLLGAGTLFAFGNFTYTVIKFLGRDGENFVACSGRLASNPLTTPCFFGLLFYLAAFLVSLYLWRKQSQQEDAVVESL